MNEALGASHFPNFQPDTFRKENERIAPHHLDTPGMCAGNTFFLSLNTYGKDESDRAFTRV
jgi:hypothetical protein